MEIEILQICRNIENEHTLNKTNYRFTINDRVRPNLTRFVKKLKQVFSNSDILVDSLKKCPTTNLVMDLKLNEALSASFNLSLTGRMEIEILQICRNIENEHTLNKTNYRFTINDRVRPNLTRFVKKLEQVFSNSDILVDSLKRYIIIDWSKKDDLE